MVEYGFVKKVDTKFDDVCALLPDELQKQGFGIITRIAMHEKLHEKLGVTIPRYIIFGACNPKFAHKAITLEEEIGLLLPCNVVVYEKDDKTVIGIIKPSVAMNMVHNEDLEGIAGEVEERLKKVFNSIQ